MLVFGCLSDYFDPGVGFWLFVLYVYFGAGVGLRLFDLIVFILVLVCGRLFLIILNLLLVRGCHFLVCGGGVVVGLLKLFFFPPELYWHT